MDNHSSHVDQSELEVETADVAEKQPGEYEQALGESPAETINLDTWSSGDDLSTLYSELEQKVQEAVIEEGSLHQRIRQEIMPEFSTGKRAIPESGLHRFDTQLLEKAHRGFLFNGSVEAADGTIASHDALPITITQIGVCLVSYHGTQGSYVHRIFRKDFQPSGGNPIQDILELLNTRKKRGAVASEDKQDQFSNLLMRGIMAYAERAFLLERSSANWRMGHGNPTPYELLTGFWAHEPSMVKASLNLMRRLVLDHRRFIYIPSTTKRRELLTLGNALKPLEYLILVTTEQDLLNMVETGGYRGDNRKNVKKFAHEVGSQIVTGLYRVSEAAPPYVFYAHREFVHEAALIAMADSVLQLHRGFPTLIDLADKICQVTFGANDFLSTVRLAYGHSGEPFRYLGERETRS